MAEVDLAFGKNRPVDFCRIGLRLPRIAANALSLTAAGSAQQIPETVKPNQTAVYTPENLDAHIEKAVEKHVYTALAKLSHNLLDANQTRKRPTQASEILSHKLESGMTRNGLNAASASETHRM